MSLIRDNQIKFDDGERSAEDVEFNRKYLRIEVRLMENLEWYVLNYNWNKKKIENFNIFRSYRFSEGVKDLLKYYTTFDEFVEELEKELMYAFWAKREYEISVGDAFETDLDKYEKLDVYWQVKPNVRILAKYILDNSDLVK